MFTPWASHPMAGLHLPTGGTYIAAAAFSPDGKLVASAGGDQLLRVWSTATGAQIASADLASLLDIPLAVAFAADGAVLAGTDRGVILRFRTLPSATTPE